MRKYIQDIFASEKVRDHYDPIHVSKVIKTHNYTYIVNAYKGRERYIYQTATNDYLGRVELLNYPYNVQEIP